MNKKYALKKLLLLFSIIISLFFNKLSAQTQHQQSGWFMMLNNTRFNDKWGLQLDVQVRSFDNWSYVRNTLFRPGLTYSLNKNNNVALGYLLATTFNRSDDASVNNLNEHRIWEQYIVTHKLKSVFASHRFRVEQRFIERNGAEDIFAQRFRYFFRLIQPIQPQTQQGFNKGVFIALQNEIFLNLQHKNELNKSIFDQNRGYLAAGYRFSKKFDIEAGYMNQAIHGLQNNTINNITQLALYTRF